ncbi:MAG: efflux RND transporter periplasmic adaptor subunit, partial [Pseudomonadota bacterium]|nr:efflux RND transporter periplasmic adaptor subunit [Pseudomonadota bacterium]
GNPRVVLRAPTNGVVASLQVRQGQRVRAGMALMTVNGLDTVWVEAAVPQAQAAGIVPGTPVTVRVSAFPGQTFDGEVESLLPDLDSTTRTQRARIVLENPVRRLVPGMFAEVAFAGAQGERRPLVPDDALIATGTDARVIVATGDGRFRPVRVAAGRSAGGRTAILRGLKGGERVVVSGQFLIDSESSLSGALERLSPPDAGVEETGETQDDDMADMDLPAVEGKSDKPRSSEQPR